MDKKINRFNRVIVRSFGFLPAHRRTCALVHLCTLFLVLWYATTGYADDKVWSGGGDASTWEDTSNWFPSALPASSDDILIDGDFDVTVSSAFSAQSLTLGGRGESLFTIEQFIYGTIAPEESTDNALYIRKGGVVELKKPAGTLVLKGSMKLSDETLANEPAFMFLAE